MMELNRPLLFHRLDWYASTIGSLALGFIAGVLSGREHSTLFCISWAAVFLMAVYKAWRGWSIAHAR